MLKFIDSDFTRVEEGDEILILKNEHKPYTCGKKGKVVWHEKLGQYRYVLLNDGLVEDDFVGIEFIVIKAKEDKK